MDFDGSDDEHGDVTVFAVIILCPQKCYHEHGYANMLTNNLTKIQGSTIEESRLTFLQW